MQCPSCGGPELLSEVRDLTFTFKGRSMTVENLKGEFCPLCDDGVLDVQDGNRYDNAIMAFIKLVNSELYDPAFISKVRKKMGLGQGEAGDIFGGGKSGFCAYENGRKEPPISLVKLFMILDRHPELLPEIITK